MLGDGGGRTTRPHMQAHLSCHPSALLRRRRPCRRFCCRPTGMRYRQPSHSRSTGGRSCQASGQPRRFRGVVVIMRFDCDGFGHRGGECSSSPLALETITVDQLTTSNAATTNEDHTTVVRSRSRQVQGRHVLPPASLLRRVFE